MTSIPTIAGAAAAIAEGRLSPVALTEACLERIDRHEPKLNAFIRLERERALASARAAEAEIKANEDKYEQQEVAFHTDIHRNEFGEEIDYDQVTAGIDGELSVDEGSSGLMLATGEFSKCLLFFVAVPLLTLCYLKT